MKATVVVTCYNQEKYIKECLESIVHQQVDFDFDILVADDCSTDSSLQIIKECKAIYGDKLTLIVHSANLGHPETYVRTHKQAQGEIVFHIDGDDVMLPGKLQKQYDIFRTNPNVNLVFHKAEYFSDDERYTANTGSPLGVDACGLLYFNANDLAKWGSITVHSSYAYRKSSRTFPRGAVDFIEWFFAMDSLLPTGQGVYLDEILVRYRCNQVGTSYLSTPKGRKKAYNISLNDLMYYFSQHKEFRKNLYANALVTFGGMIRSRCFIAKYVFFLAKNIRYFNWGLTKNVARMRLAVAPETRIR